MEPYLRSYSSESTRFHEPIYVLEKQILLFIRGILNTSSNEKEEEELKPVYPALEVDIATSLEGLALDKSAYERDHFKEDEKMWHDTGFF